MSEEAVAAVPETPQPAAAASVPDAQNPAEPAPVDKAAPTPEQAEKQSGSRRFERKLDRAIRREAEASARADLLERQLNELRQPKAASQGEPKMSEFSDIEEYAKAKAEFEKGNLRKEFEAQRHADTQKEQHTRLLSEWETKATRAETKYEDFDEVVGELEPNAPWTVAIMRAKNGEDIAYHLGKNIQEAKRIMSLDPIDQFLEIGELGAKLAATPVKPKEPSRVPAPIDPVGGTKSAGNDVPSSQDDMATWARKFRKARGIVK